MSYKIPEEYLSRVDPELVTGLTFWPANSMTDVFVRETRHSQATEGMNSLSSSQRLVEEIIPGTPGNPDVRLLIADFDHSITKKPVLLHIHGGGLVLGKPDYIPDQLRNIAADCECVVVSVDYRWAPEAKFPAALDDCYAATHWLHNNAEHLGIDKSRIALAGESAGGGLAAALAIACRDRGEYLPVQLVLIYPMLDDRTGSTRRAPSHLGQAIWSESDNHYGWRAYLDTEPGAHNVSFLASPARLTEFANLCPTWIGVGALDLFVEENIAFAAELIAAGVEAELLVVPGAYHAFDLAVPDAFVSRSFKRSWKRSIRKSFGLTCDA